MQQACAIIGFIGICNANKYDIGEVTEFLDLLAEDSALLQNITEMQLFQQFLQFLKEMQS